MVNPSRHESAVLETFRRDLRPLQPRNPLGKADLLGGGVVIERAWRRLVRINPPRQPRAILSDAGRQLGVRLFREGHRIIDLLLRGGRGDRQRQFGLRGRLGGVKETGKRSLIRHGMLPVLVLGTYVEHRGNIVKI